MKKRTQKLTLNRETLRLLGTNEMSRVVGATEDTSSACFEATHCECVSDGCINPTWQHTCGTVCDIPSWHC